MSKLSSRAGWTTLLLSVLITASCAFDTSNGGSAETSNDGGGVAPDSAGSNEDAGGMVPTDSSTGQPDAMPEEDCVGEDLPFPILNLEDCDPEKPTGPLELLDSDVTYFWNTVNGNITNSANAGVSSVPFAIVSKLNSPDLFVASVSQFILGSNSELVITGPNAFVLLSTGNIEISGDFLAIGRGATSGPGGNHASACSIGRGATGSTQTDNDGRSGGSGGAGGALGTAGGAGAAIDDVSAGAIVSAGGTSFNPTLVPLNGGCSGGAGGNNGGAGGGGGGAIQLIAAGKLTVSSNAVISTSGGGGRGASGASAGGGGGGSGGALLMQAETVENSGRTTYNGGGGGEGTRDGSGSPSHGDDGHPYDDSYARGALGGSSGGNGGDGASDFFSADDGREGFSNSDDVAGGGGGGGGLGIVRTQSNT